MKWSLANLICIFVIGIRKTLVMGSVPTENLPEKNHEAHERECSVFVKKSDTPVVDDKPSTSSEHRSEPQYSDIEDFMRQLERKSVQPCQVERSSKDEIRFELWYFISISFVYCSCDFSLEFTVFPFNWPVPDHHSIYLEQKHSVQYLV
jgi:hypothetical protein